MCEGGDVSSGGSTVSYYPTSRQHDTTPSNTNSLPPHPTTTSPPDLEGFSGYPTTKITSNQNQKLHVGRKCGWELKVERELKIVTDYTGIETLCMSLDILGRNYKLLSISEINAGARRFVEENFKPKEIRECAEITPMDQCKNCDLYCAGFPCQDFSYNNTARTGTSSYRGQAYHLCGKN